MAKPTYDTIDSYIESCEPQVQKVLRQLREIIRQNAPEATEKIAWAMPTYVQNGNLIHFCAHKKHIGVYPGERGIRAFAPRFEQAGYRYSKGAVQFPLCQPLPQELIAQIVRFLVAQTEKE